MYANTRSFRKYSSIINKGNNGVFAEGSEVGDLLGDYKHRICHSVFKEEDRNSFLVVLFLLYLNHC